jgi:hypothetical protein
MLWSRTFVHPNQLSTDRAIMTKNTLLSLGAMTSFLLAVSPTLAFAALRTDEPSARHAVTKVLTSEDERAGLTDLEGKPSAENPGSEIEKVTYRAKPAGEQERKAALRQRLDAYMQRREKLREEFQQPQYDALAANIEANDDRTIQ